MTPAERVDRIKEEATGQDLSSWEKFEFLPSIRHRSSLTLKQEAVLRKIEERLFEDDG